MTEEASPVKVTLDDLRFEVRRARRLGRSRVAVRRLMACPSCSVDGEPFSPGPILLEVEVQWAQGVTGREAVERAVDDCAAAARSAGIEVAE